MGNMDQVAPNLCNFISRDPFAICDMLSTNGTTGVQLVEKSYL